MTDIVYLSGAYDKIQTTTSVAYAGFNVNVKFSIPQKGDKCDMSEKIYMSVQLRIMQTRDDGLSSYNLEPNINTGSRAIITTI